MTKRGWPIGMAESATVILGLALGTTACGSGGKRPVATASVGTTDLRASTAGEVVAAEASPDRARPPSGTVPPRSFKPVFSGEAAVVEKAFREGFDAFERQDVDAAVALGFIRLADRKGLAVFMNAYRVHLYRINSITVTGRTAVLEYENAIVGRNLKTDVTTLLAQHEIWVKIGGQWKFDSDIASAPGIPSDLPSVAVTLRDHAQTVVPSPLPKGEFALSLHNSGATAKGVFILGVPADLDVPSFLEQQAKSTTPGFQDDILEMGATADIPAGETGAMVFSRALAAGRYLLLSRKAKDGDDLPGEYAEFTVS